MPYKRHIIPFAAAVLIASLAWMVLLQGCAHQSASRPQEKAAPAKSETLFNKQQNAAILTPALNHQVVTQSGQRFKMVNTPFGVIKQPLPEPESAAPPTETPQKGEQAPPQAGKTKSTERPAEKIAAPAAPKPDEAQQLTVERDAPVSSGADSGQEGQGVTLNFDDADLYEVIRFMAEILGINYMVDPGVSGRVSIHTAGKLRQQDLFPLFYQILEANGLTAVREGPIYKITSLKEAARLPLLSRTGRQARNLPPEERVIMQIIPLQHIKAEEMTKIITPFISAEGTVIAHADTNTLLLVDKGINILKVLKLVENFDVDLFTSVRHRFYAIQYNSAEEMSKVLAEVLTAYSSSLAKETTLIPITHLNTLLVLSRREKVFEQVASLIKTMDTPNAAVQPRIYVYTVKNGRADELADLLNTVFSTTAAASAKGGTLSAEGQGGKSNAAKPIAGNPFMRPSADKTETTTEAPAAPAPLAGGAGGGEAQGSSTLRGDLKITPDPIRNALIIEAIPPDYRVVQDILERLDVLPRQVLIEAVIAEIQLGDDSEFGIDWEYKDGTGHPSTRLLSAAIGGEYAGLLYNIGQTDRWSATLKAKMEENKANILSAPSVLASNDKEAKIDISDEIPVASSELQYTGTGDTPLIQTSIEYRDTGLLLSVTPHINENGLVTLELSHELSETADAVSVGGRTYPSFKKRSVSTSLTVGHEQTIVIGGLISKNISKTDSGVPVLRRIPLLGYLFGRRTDKETKKELIIMITPRVIVNLNDVDEVTNEFKAKVTNITY